MSWEIKLERTLNDQGERKEYWEGVHGQGYRNDVWSLTQDSHFQTKTLAEVKRLGNIRRVLIPGCGSLGILERLLADNFPHLREIRGVDFPAVAEVARKNCEGLPVINHESADISAMPYRNEFDLVIVVNSVLSDDHDENMAILASCRQALKPGGILLGFFPTVLATLDIAYIEDRPERLQCIDLPNSVFHEPLQKVSQIFYTPLRLRKLLLEAGLTRRRMEIFFCEGPESLAESRKHYEIEDPDLPLYELIVIAVKAIE